MKRKDNNQPQSNSPRTSRLSLRLERVRLLTVGHLEHVGGGGDPGGCTLPRTATETNMTSQRCGEG